MPYRDFASNVGITYNTPEEFFLGEAPQAFTRVFEPVTYLDETSSKAAHSSKLSFRLAVLHFLDVPAAPTSFSKNSIPDIVLLCGSPGAGNPPSHSLPAVGAQMRCASNAEQGRVFFLMGQV